MVLTDKVKESFGGVKNNRSASGFPLLVNRKTVSELSGADELFDMQIFQVKTIEEPGYIWFCNADERDVVEESIAFPNYNEVISIIHLKDELWIKGGIALQSNTA